MADPLSPARNAVKLGKTIQKLRKDRGESLPVFATRIGLDKGHLWRIEAGQTEPTLPTLRTIARALGVKPGALVDAASTSRS